MPDSKQFPVLTTDQIRELDRRAIEAYGVPGVVLMENAGRGVAQTLVELGIAGKVVICCGKGNNAGDGFVVARHLDAAGVDVDVLLWAQPEEIQGDAAINGEILGCSDVPLRVYGRDFNEAGLPAILGNAQWVVDALLGTGAKGEPRCPICEALPALNGCDARKLAIDVPTGLDAQTGRAYPGAFRSEYTCTFVAAKPGLVAREAAGYVGELRVIGLGVPRRLLAEFGL